MQSVRRILSDVSSGKRTAQHAVEESLERIDADDGRVRAFRSLADREALLRSVGQQKGPLAGIACGVKDIFDTADLPTGYGSGIYDGWQPRADASIVAMTRQAGAAIVGKTVTTEFAFFSPGPTVNPHHENHTPGGSSSGSAAAVAAGMVPAAIGTQTGGSVIRPAAFCGVAGYKPSFRLAPTTGMKTFSWSLDTTGFFAASVDDVALFSGHVLGRNLEAQPVSPPQIRIGLFRSAVWDEAEEEMREAVMEAVDRLAHAGATIIDIAEPEELTSARHVHSTIQNHEAARAMAWEHANCRNELSEKLVEALDAGSDISSDAYDRARGVARKARKTATMLFDHVDILITPSAPGRAPEGLSSTGDPKFNKLWTLTGNPCVNIPGFRDTDGLPLGVQFVGRFARDQRLLSIASWAEELF